MKRQLAKAVEIGVETVNYWIISYALSSMAMIFSAEWIFVLFFASNVWLIGRYYDRTAAVLNVSRVGLVQGSVIPFANSQ